MFIRLFMKSYWLVRARWNVFLASVAFAVSIAAALALTARPVYSAKTVINVSDLCPKCHRAHSQNTDILRLWKSPCDGPFPSWP